MKTEMVGQVEAKAVAGMNQAQQIITLLDDVLVGDRILKEHAIQIRTILIGEIEGEGNCGENLRDTPLSSDSLLPFIIEKLREIKSVQTYAIEQNEMVVRNIEVPR